MRYSAVILSLFILMGCAVKVTAPPEKPKPQAVETPKFSRHYKNSLFKVTERGLYSVEVVVKGDGLDVGPNKIDLIVHNRMDRDVTGAEIAILQWKEGGKAVPFPAPRIVERGGGTYSVEPLHIGEPGRWKLRVTVKAPGGEDGTVFDLPVIMPPKPGPPGDAIKPERQPGPPPHADADRHERRSGQAPLDMVPTPPAVKTVRGNFLVSYESVPPRPPINAIHSWRLTVRAENGDLIPGLAITVDGGMPAHGHGLPTKPVVTKELEQGVYLVEGMKFSMPGIWRVRFHIEGKRAQDDALFVLDVK